MKNFSALKIMVGGLGVTAAAAVVLTAGPLPRNQVPADVKWLIHLDLDSFRATKVGQVVQNQLLPEQLTKARDTLKLFFDFDLDWNSLHSLTAFGTDFQPKPNENGVLLIKTDAKTRTSLAATLERLAQKGGDKDGAIKKLSSDSYPLFSLKNELFIAGPAEDLVVVSKSRSQLERAVAVLNRRADNMAANKSFADYPKAPRSFVFLGVAEGFSASSGLLNPSSASTTGAEGRGMQSDLLPKAKILQMADAGQAVLGEENGELYLNLFLKARTPDVSTQMQQVLQGIIAIVSLSQPQNKELNDLVRSVKVSAEGKWVSIKLSYPVQEALDAIGKLGEARDRKAKTAADSANKKEKQERGQKAKTEAESPDKPSGQ